MVLGQPVYLPEQGPGEIWYWRPTGQLVVRLHSGDYVDTDAQHVTPVLPRGEVAALKRGDQVRDVYGVLCAVREVNETGQRPPTLVLLLPDGSLAVRVWYEIAALVP